MDSQVLLLPVRHVNYLVYLIWPTLASILSRNPSSVTLSRLPLRPHLILSIGSPLPMRRHPLAGPDSVKREHGDTLSHNGVSSRLNSLRPPRWPIPTLLRAWWPVSQLGSARGDRASRMSHNPSNPSGHHSLSLITTSFQLPPMPPAQDQVLRRGSLPEMPERQGDLSVRVPIS